MKMKVSFLNLARLEKLLRKQKECELRSEKFFPEEASASDKGKKMIRV